jgi:hypothetical protein
VTEGLTAVLEEEVDDALLKHVIAARRTDVGCDIICLTADLRRSSTLTQVSSMTFNERLYFL